MRTPRILRTATFRLALFYAALFVLSAALLVAFFDLTISQYARRALRSDVAAETELLLRTAPQGRAAGVAGLVRQREQVLGSQEFSYLVLGPDGRLLAGDLPREAARDGWGRVEVGAPADSREYEAETAEVRTLGARLPGGGILVVGRSTYAFHELRESMISASLVAAALIGVMSLAVAILIGGLFLSRIDRVSEAAARIMGGRLEERLPALGMGDEFDRLAVNLNRMLDRMQSLMEGLRQVSSDIAHDLRTPLMRLRRRLEAALADPARPSGQDQPITEALGQLDEILATFGALLRIAQVEGGTGREAFRSIELSELMQRVREVYEPVAEDQGKLLTADIAAGVVIAGDEELLTQLICNLIENAFTHAASSATVSLEVSTRGERAVLAVADRGPGVPDAEREEVLRRFYRLDRSRTTPGAGLGLAMAQAIAQLHAGDLELQDNRPGLIVRASFPRARCADAKA